jgi:hypothetical protein
VQERLLKAEGIVFDKAGRTNLAIFQWAGPGSPTPGRRERKPRRRT